MAHAGKERPPATLDRLRALLDEAAVRRVLIPLTEPAAGPAAIAASLALPLSSVAHALPAEADGDRLMLIVPGDRRVDLRQVALILGAKRVTLSGTPRTARHVHPPALVSGLPTVIDRALLSREALFGESGDPQWVLKISPEALCKVTQALTADITRAAPVSAERDAAE